ncbi:MAG TPA: YraN family protein [Chitinophagaceae bacterium]|nr:YraN family protein [Chitinophagaceae bacterium]
MAIHNDFGKEAEQLATKWLAENGFCILHRNWRHGSLEIDIVARKEKYLHFIEVKALRGKRRPEESVRKKKFKKLQRAVHEYIFRFPGDGWIRYDILAITVNPGKKPEYFLIEDVFL